MTWEVLIRDKQIECTAKFWQWHEIPLDLFSHLSCITMYLIKNVRIHSKRITIGRQVHSVTHGWPGNKKISNFLYWYPLVFDMVCKACDWPLLNRCFHCKQASVQARAVRVGLVLSIRAGRQHSNINNLPGFFHELVITSQSLQLAPVLIFLSLHGTRRKKKAQVETYCLNIVSLLLNTTLPLLVFIWYHHFLKLKIANVLKFKYH